WAGALAPPAKKVVVYRNGDPFFHGKKFVVNQRRFLTFEVFLKEVTRSIQAPLAVRNLYTPRHGHRIAELGDLQDGQQYVAAGFEKFKRLNSWCRKGNSPGSCRNSGSWHALGCFCCSVFRNGDLLSPPFQLLFSQSSPLQWDTLLAVLTAKADLRSGAVNRLCRLDGTQVLGKEELVHGGYYVAVGAEEYKKLPYFELLVPQDSTHRTPWYVGSVSLPSCHGYGILAWHQPCVNTLRTFCSNCLGKSPRLFLVLSMVCTALRFPLECVKMKRKRSHSALRFRKPRDCHLGHEHFPSEACYSSPRQ
uniref:Doublecortin domain containing 2B n=1 Tax=Cairina moschata TaxID=8855 RepID=A0A8C3CQI0_CAIMO